MLSTDDATSPSADVSNFHGGRGVAISRNGDDHDEGDDYEGEEDEDDNDSANFSQVVAATKIQTGQAEDDDDVMKPLGSERRLSNLQKGARTTLLNQSFTLNAPGVNVINNFLE